MSTTALNNTSIMYSCMVKLSESQAVTNSLCFASGPDSVSCTIITKCWVNEYSLEKKDLVQNKYDKIKRSCVYSCVYALWLHLKEDKKEKIFAYKTKNYNSDSIDLESSMGNTSFIWNSFGYIWFLFGFPPVFFNIKFN